MTSSERASFAAAVTCIDGRVHEPVVGWVRSRFDVEFVDLLTQAGPDLALCSHGDDEVGHVRRQLGVSTGAHAPRVLVVAGHADCAANPASGSEHRRQVCCALSRAREWAPGLPVVGVWVDADGRVEQLDCPAPEG